MGESSTNKLYGDLLARYLNNLKEMSVVSDVFSLRLRTFNSEISDYGTGVEGA